MSPKIVFYLPPRLWPQTWPQHADDLWPGFGLGVYAWTVQTWLRLQSAGVACDLSQTLPEAGIVLFHSNASGPGFPRPNRQQLFICLKAEAPPSPYAQLQVVQNPQEATDRQVFIPHWPQPGLIPRAAQRGDRFETVAFLGHQNNLAPELRSPDWPQQLQELGLRWQPVITQNRWSDYATLDNRWHDYRDIDAIVAVRSFDPKVHWQTGKFRHKPATKLYNAWLAGVPALLGVESAFQAIRQSPLDYLETATPAALLAELARLQGDKPLRQAMRAQAAIRGQDYTPAATTQRWIAFLEKTALPTYERWCQLSPAQQHWLQLQSQTASWRDRLTRRLRS